MSRRLSVWFVLVAAFTILFWPAGEPSPIHDGLDVGAKEPTLREEGNGQQPWDTNHRDTPPNERGSDERSPVLVVPIAPPPIRRVVREVSDLFWLSTKELIQHLGPKEVAESILADSTRVDKVAAAVKDEMGFYRGAFHSRGVRVSEISRELAERGLGEKPAGYRGRCIKSRVRGKTVWVLEKDHPGVFVISDAIDEIPDRLRKFMSRLIE